MTDLIHLYPNSSCYTAECKGSYPVPQGTPTNMSNRNCEFPEYLDCYYKAEIRKELQPRNEEGWYALNPQLYTEKQAKDFDMVPCKIGNPTEPQWISPDPRLFSSTRADYLVLDRPPMTGKVRLADIYDKKWDNYGKTIEPYTDVRDGDITYYIDKSIAPAFYKPVFSEPAEETLNLYKDPMGAYKPEANRTPILNTNNPTTTRAPCYPYCLSSLQDSQSYREDLMALQQRKHNQEKWTVRWN